MEDASRVASGLPDVARPASLSRVTMGHSLRRGTAQNKIASAADWGRRRSPGRGPRGQSRLHPQSSNTRSRTMVVLVDGSCGVLAARAAVSFQEVTRSQSVGALADTRWETSVLDVFPFFSSMGRCTPPRKSEGASSILGGDRLAFFVFV